MINLSKLMSKSRVSEVSTAAKRMIMEFLKGDWSEETHLTDTFNELQVHNPELESAINREKAISNLEEKDEIRDKKVQAVNYVILGYLHNPETAIKTAAEAINKIFSRYGVEIVNDNYSEESAFIDSMLNDLAAEDLQSPIAALPGLSSAINELRTAEDEFVAARLEYEKQDALISNSENATMLKAKVLNVINNKLIIYLRAMSTMNEAKYGEFTLTIAKIIDDNNEVVKKRGNKSEPVEAE